MESIYCDTTKHGKFFYKVKQDPNVKPKQVCVEQANKHQAEFLIEKQTNAVHRQFGYYKSVDDYIDENKNKNIHAYEILYADCKLYFDIEYKDKGDEFFYDIMTSIKKHFELFFKQKIDEKNIYVSSGSGIGESTTYQNEQKYSYHVVFNNGYFCESNNSFF